MADKKLYFRIGDDGEYKLATLNGKNNGVWNGVAWDNTSKFSDDSWETIAHNIKAGTDHYSLGDTKTDTLTIGGNTYTATFKIVDDTVGRYVTQSGQSHKVIEMQELVGLSDGSGVAWNSSSSLTSFNASNIKTALNNTIINFLPAELQAVLETTTVYSGDGTQTASASTNVGATCKLFVASYNEYYGTDASNGWANNTETNGKGQFTWYQQAGVTTSNYEDMIKYKIEDTSTAYYYWTRSPYGRAGGIGRAARVIYDGRSGIGPVDSDDSWVAPCFAW